MQENEGLICKDALRFIKTPDDQILVGTYYGIFRGTFDSSTGTEDAIDNWQPWLKQNYPNPFNTNTTIRFDLLRNQAVSLSIYNITGGLVKTLLTGQNISAGTHVVQWDGCNANGQPVPGGVYLYQLQTEVRKETRWMVVIH